MSAAAPKPSVVPTPVALEPEQAWRNRVRVLLNGTPAAKLPMALFDAHVSHATAMLERQGAEDEVRDAEHAWREIKVTDETTMKARAAVKQTLDLARKKLRALLYVEHLALGALESVRAAVELTMGGRR